MHIDFIRRSLPDGALSTKSNSVSFISLNEKEGIIKIQYGSFIIEFPINSPITSAIYEWSQDYVVQFD
jgi:hypothetical protein